MDFKQLEAFAQVVRLGSFSRAAEALFLTQPTISAHVGALERELGARLIDRTAKAALPTEAGRVLFDYAVDLLALRESALSACRQAGRLSGTLCIAASTVTYQYVLPRAMSRFRKRHPEVAFDIRGCDSAAAARAIAAGRAELAMTGAVTGGDPCRYEGFMTDQLVVITPNAPPFDTLAEAAFSLDALLSHPFIIREPGSGTRQAVEEHLQRHGLSAGSLRVAACMEEPDAIKNAVSLGLGISVISRLAVDDFQKLGLLRVFSLAGRPIERQLYLVCHKSRPLSPPAAAFMDFILTEAGGAP